MSIVYLCVGMSLVMGVIGGLNQTRVQKLCTFSGMTHICRDNVMVFSDKMMIRVVSVFDDM